MLCPRCNKNKTIVHPMYGPIHCDECRFKDEHVPDLPEFVSQSKKDRIQAQRDKHWQDTEPPFIGNKPNPEFVKINKKIAKEYFTEDELKGL